jgi:hypothetical protein
MSKTDFDFIALENAETAAFVDFHRAAPAEVRAAHELDAQEVGSATCFTCRDLDPPAVFRRAARLGVARPATEKELDEVQPRLCCRT